MQMGPSRQETADETAKHFGIPHAFADLYKMVQHPDVDLVSMEFKELSSVVANQRQQVKIVETGETIQMTAPDQVLISGVLQSGAVASVHLKGGDRAA
jgi:hypothetical protein